MHARAMEKKDQYVQLKNAHMVEWKYLELREECSNTQTDNILLPPQKEAKQKKKSENEKIKQKKPKNELKKSHKQNNNK